jgi:hypothetical protein
VSVDTAGTTAVPAAALAVAAVMVLALSAATVSAAATARNLTIMTSSKVPVSMHRDGPAGCLEPKDREPYYQGRE